MNIIPRGAVQEVGQMRSNMSPHLETLFLKWDELPCVDLLAKLPKYGAELPGLLSIGKPWIQFERSCELLRSKLRFANGGVDDGRVEKHLSRVGC